MIDPHEFIDNGNGFCKTCGKLQPFPGYLGASDWVHDPLFYKLEKPCPAQS